MGIISAESFIHPLRLTVHEARGILNRMDQEKIGSQAEHRTSERRRCSCYATGVVAIKHPGGTCARFQMVPREMSDSGLSFLIRSFVYPGTTCVITLNNAAGQSVNIDGRVAYCTHVERSIHACGIRFTVPLSVDDFIPPADRLARSA